MRPGGATRVPGLYVAGDLTGTPLLKFALDSGARLAARLAAELGPGPRPPDALDLVIVGGGVAGFAAAVEARRHGLRFEILEAAAAFSTIANFPHAKPIFTYPGSMIPRGSLQVHADVKEALHAELLQQVGAAGIRARPGRAVRVTRSAGTLEVHLEGGEILRARRVIVAIGRSGDYRRLGVPGEDRDHVFNRLHDPRDHAGRRVLVVGGGDSAVETAVALAEAGARVTLCHRGAELTRPGPANLERLASWTGPAPGAGDRIELMLTTRVEEIRVGEVRVRGPHGARTLAADVVFPMIGRQAPLDFFRRSGVPISGEPGAGHWIGLSLFVMFCAWLYDWKSGGFFNHLWYSRGWFPTHLTALLETAGGSIATAARDPGTLIGTLAISASGPAFWYTLAYSIAIVVFGAQRIARRRTPYVAAQTITLTLIQVGPLFLIPEVVLPLLYHHGLVPAGLLDALFPAVSYGHGREFWRAYGLILAWPLNVYNVFTAEPLWAWIAIGFVQTFVLIPAAVYFFGKGAYCGWVCSCGALAETLGDTHRHKMPHGPFWNRANLAGQVILGVAFLLLAVRIAGWVLPDGNPADRVFEPLKEGYKWTVDVFLAGVVGYGVYFWYSGRFWCRLMCPLAALMNVYARFSSFRIFADKKRCISCGQCTRVCHQGIDVMSFANRGLPMADPECVRCSACVQECPTGVLAFGRYQAKGTIVKLDTLAASPVRAREAVRD